MRVAWIAHHNLDTPGGGAEMTDREMIDRRPSHVDVDVLHPRQFQRLGEYDRVVVSRLEEMPAGAAPAIAATEPVFFSHGDVLPRSDPVRMVVRASRPFIAQTPLSLDHIERWSGASEMVTMVPYMDLAGIRVGEKKDVALWPHRNVAHKGLDLARKWSADKGVFLKVMSGRPRSEVLAEMASARWVVLLSKILDGCPRSIREAQLSGCEIVVNDLVGWWDIPRMELRARTLQAPDIFWRRFMGA